MAGHLKLPNDRRRVDQLAFNELMRITWQNDPAVAMKLGTPDHHVLMIIGKDGVVRSMKPNQYAGTVSFIDYLLENESVTIFGSAEERTEDDLAPMKILPANLPNLEIGCWRGEVPDYVPYKMKNPTSFFHAINVPSTKFGRIALSFESNRDFTKFSRSWMPYGPLVSKNSRNQFMGYSEHPLEEWHTHGLIKSHGVEDPASWPRI